MASPMDIVQIPGYPGLFTRRVVVEMWQRAGSPPINDAGRLYSTQKAAWVAYQNGTGSPADNPDRPDIYPLAHVRFAALDVVNSARGAMTAAGFEYPYSYEPWHAQLPNIYAYPLVDSIPASAFTDATPFIIPQEDEMSYPIRLNKTHLLHIGENGFIKHFATNAKVGNEGRGVADLTKDIVSSTDSWIDLDTQNFLYQLDSFGIPRWVVDVNTGWVQNPRTGVLEAGGMWSWSRLAAENSDKLVTLLSASEAVEPPKA